MVKRIIAILSKISYATLGLVVLFLFAFLLGHEILDSQTLVGHDSRFALPLIDWFDRWFPRVPLWYPLQGTGVSLFHSYPMLTTFLAISIHRLSHFSQSEVLRILEFLTFPLTAFGIYFFVWSRFKSQTAGLLAGIFFLLSQASWVFQRLHGIFAQSFSLVFVPPALLFFDLFLERTFSFQGKGFSRRFFLILAVLSLTLLFLCHVVSGIIVSGTLLLYGIFFSQLGLGKSVRTKERISRSFKFLLAAGLVVILAIALGAFWLAPFHSYNRLANREGLLTMNLGQLKEVSLQPLTLLGFNNFIQGDFRYDYFFFALPVLILGLIGLVISFFKQKKVFLFGVIAFLALLYTSLPIYAPFLVRLISYIYTATYFRTIIIALILLPVVASFGALSLGKIGFLAILISVLFIRVFEHKPPSDTIRESKPYGISEFDAYGPSLNDDFEILKKGPKFVLDNFPEFYLNPSQGVDEEGTAKELFSELGVSEVRLDSNVRLDISPFAYGGAMMQVSGMFTNASTINLYHYPASIIHAMWGYQAGVFYGQEKIYDDPIMVSELTKWFGPAWVILTPGFDRLRNFEKAGWEFVKTAPGRDIHDQIFRYREATGVYSLSSRPVGLVIGDLKVGAYPQVFRLANKGAVPYDQAWLVEGKKNIDDYSKHELEQFDFLILHGYSYKNRSSAWKLLRDYVGGGGKLFIDTGWQFVDRDWGRIENGQSVPIDLPLPAPVSKTKWGNIGISWEGVKINQEIVKDISISDFGEPVWADSPWGMSLAETSALRENTIPILTKGDKVIIAAGSYGQGKVIWSGMNFISHALEKRSSGEVVFLKQLMGWLMGEGGKSKDYKVAYQRDYPDNASFEFIKNSGDPTWFLFRESYSSNWQASLVSEGKKRKLTVYRAGPGFVLIKMPPVTSGTTLRLEYRLSFLEGVLAKLISALTLLALIGYLLLGERIERAIGRKFGKSLGKYWRRITRTISVDEAEDY